MPQIEIQGVSLVLIGSFNPAIFHPSWFAAYNLIRKEEAETADTKIIHSDIADFKLGWLSVNVLRDRLQLGTVQESYYEALRDIAVGVLQLLSHTPVTMMGINREFHFNLLSEDAWNGLGYRLVPKQDWEPFLKRPGLTVLTEEGLRPDEYKGYIRVSVQPSPRVSFGVYVHVNDHYQLISDGKEIGGADKARIILSEKWSESMKRGLDIAQGISSLGEKK
jgi:hypothetical protein